MRIVTEAKRINDHQRACALSLLPLFPRLSTISTHIVIYINERVSESKSSYVLWMYVVFLHLKKYVKKKTRREKPRTI